MSLPAGTTPGHTSTRGSTRTGGGRPLELGALTPRGAVTSAVGAVVVGVAALTGSDGFLRVGVVALALPLVSLALAHLARPQLEVVRSLAPARVPAGGTARVRLALRTTGWLPPRHLRAEDARDPALGRPSRFVVERRGAARTSVTYALRPTRRGRYAVGPLRATAVDPLGLVRGLPATTAPVPATARGGRTEVAMLLVLPVVQELPPLPAGTAWAGSGERATLSVTTSGEHSSGAREYRPGDYVRRVHWRATARSGRLMVRQEEDPLQHQAVVLLDTAAAAWGSSAAFEAAVSAAASVVSLLGSSGGPVQLVLRSSAHAGTTDELLDELAVVQAEDGGDGVPGGPAGTVPFAGLSGMGRSGTPASVVAVLGSLGPTGGAGAGAGSPPGGPLLLHLPQRGVRAGALLLPGAAGSRPDPSAARSLRSAGWAVAEVAEGEPLADAWHRLVVAPARMAG